MTDAARTITTKQKERLDFRLLAEQKRRIERAAALTGQTVTDFAAAALDERASEVLQSHEVTELSDRDRDMFLAMLDDVDTQPNEALRAAAQTYRNHFG